MYLHPVETVIIQDFVVEALSGSPLAVYFLISFSTARDRRVQPLIPVRFCLDNTSIFGGRTAVFAFISGFFPVRAAPDQITTGEIRTIGNHAEALLAERSAILVDGDRVRDAFWSSAS